MIDRARSLTAAALLSAMLATIPVAASAGEALTVTVSAGDLNLATNAGRTVLQNRIALAVEKVCAPVRGQTPWEVEAYRTCRTTARASAVPQFDAMVANTVNKVAVRSTTPASVQ
jgi:UrcA family protein